MHRLLYAFFLFSIALCAPLQAQDHPVDTREQLLGFFNWESQKLLSLAEAMPAEAYDWRPSDGIMSVREIYLHVAEYNYTYPATSFQVEIPGDVDVEKLGDVSGKDDVVDALRRSVEHARTAIEEMPEDQLNEITTLYGRDVPGWSVLVQLISHMSEHVGQTIAYARMNDVVPPWSQ